MSFCRPIGYTAMDFIVHGLLAPDAADYITCLGDYCPEYKTLVEAARKEALKGAAGDKEALADAIVEMLSHPEAMQCQFRRCVRSFQKVYEAAAKAATGSRKAAKPAPAKKLATRKAAAPRSRR